jgi:hypothetical protein
MKITLSKSQWEFIGKKTGWITKEAGIKDNIVKYLQKIPGYQTAIQAVQEFKNGTQLKELLEKYNIQPEHLDQANNFINKFQLQSQSKNNTFITKEALQLDARVIICIIFIIFGLITFNNIKNIFEQKDNKENQKTEQTNPGRSRSQQIQFINGVN